MRTRRLQSSSNSMSSEARVSGHRTVLLHEAIESLSIEKTDTVVDATLGAGGHSQEILKRLSKRGTLIGFDADKEAIDRSQSVLALYEATIYFVNANFRYMRTELDRLSVGRVNKILFDLGWSGYQLSAGRGFSFLTDEPLSMAYDTDQSLSAHTIVNEWGEESIADILFGWGEERYSRRIAHAIVEHREKSPITTASQLAEIVKMALPVPLRYKRTHPATKTFQALRIAVNDELGALEEGLRSAWQLLEKDGRIAVITFHSLEDRIVKHRFMDWEQSGNGKRITKKPITASDAELSVNPRARSAKLRVIQKTI